MNTRSTLLGGAAAVFLLGNATVALAQATTTPGATTPPATTVEPAEQDDGTDWGWIGLLGLLGLAGLAGRKRRDHHVTTTTTARPTDPHLPPRV